MSEITIILIGIVCFFVLILFLRGVRVVPQAEAWLIERFGKYDRALTAGLNFINPIFCRVVIKQDLREMSFDLKEQLVITRDNATIYVDGIVFFKVLDPKNAYYGVQNMKLAIQNMAMTSLREVMGGLTLDESFSSRERISVELREILDNTTESWGTQVTRVVIKDIQPPQEIQNSMIKQMEAERTRRASVTEAEGFKQAAILKAEGEREANILRAEGQKKANVLMAEGQAEARMKVASAEGEAIKMIINAVAEKGNATQYLVAIKYIEAFQDIVKNQNNKLVFMPYETSGVLSSIGSIKELFSNIETK